MGTWGGQRQFGKEHRELGPCLCPDLHASPWQQDGCWGCLAHLPAASGRCPAHEQQVGVLAQELGFQHVSLSSEVMPMVRVVPRGYTACADAYLTPCIQRYLHSFRAGFVRQLQVSTAHHSTSELHSAPRPCLPMWLDQSAPFCAPWPCST